MMNVRIHTAGCVLVLLALPAVWRASAQVPAAKYEPRVGFFAFFVEHDARSARIEKQRPLDPERAAGVEGRVRNTLKLSPADFALVTVVCKRVVADLRATSEEGAKYVDSLRRSGGHPDLARLGGLESRRRQLLEGAMEELRARLTPAGWAALSKYIDSEIRPRLRWKELKNGV